MIRSGFLKRACSSGTGIYVVEVIALNIQQGDEHYLNWITNSLK